MSKDRILHVRIFNTFRCTYVTEMLSLLFIIVLILGLTYELRLPSTLNFWYSLEDSPSPHISSFIWIFIIHLHSKFHEYYMTRCYKTHAGHFIFASLHCGGVAVYLPCRLASFTGTTWRLSLEAKGNRDLPKPSVTWPCSVCSLATVKAATNMFASV